MKRIHIVISVPDEADVAVIEDDDDADTEQTGLDVLFDRDEADDTADRDDLRDVGPDGVPADVEAEADELVEEMADESADDGRPPQEAIYSGGGGGAVGHGPAKDRERALPGKILDVLAAADDGERLTTAEVHERLDDPCDKTTVQARLSELRQDGFVKGIEGPDGYENRVTNSGLLLLSAYRDRWSQGYKRLLPDQLESLRPA